MRKLILFLSVILLLFTSCAYTETFTDPFYDTHTFLFNGQPQEPVNIPKGLPDLDSLPSYTLSITDTICIHYYKDEDGNQYDFIVTCEEFAFYALVIWNHGEWIEGWVYVNGSPMPVDGFADILDMLRLEYGKEP